MNDPAPGKPSHQGEAAAGRPSIGPPAGPAAADSPVRLLAIIGLSTFLCETVVMILLLFLGLPPWIEILFDSMALSLLLSPVVYLAAFRPLIRNIRARRALAAALCKAQETLEVQVQERTAEIAATNEMLRAEIAGTRRLEDRVRGQTAAIRRAQEEIIHRLLSASLWRDEETGMHIRRTGLLSEVLARAAGWSVAEAETIRLAAPMHDVGKIGIPDAILRKPGPLTPEEFRVMQTHTLIGARILAGSETPMLKMAEEIARCHHERWDGEGYPAGLSGCAIPESARILAIVDVYDALTHDRVYRPAMPEDKVLAIMRQGVGTHFDPHLAALFFLHLSEMAHVCHENPDEPSDFLAPVSSSPVQPLSSESSAMCSLLLRHLAAHP